MQTKISKEKKSNQIQFMVFQLNDKELYGINVSKIKSIEAYTKYNVSKNEIKYNENSDILEGDINYHNKIIPMLNVEKWMGMYHDENSYEEIIVCEFNKKVICFPIFDIKNIFTVFSSALETNESNISFIMYSTIITIDDTETICKILDVEKLLSDAFGSDFKLSGLDKGSISSDKTLLIAEDSRSARSIIEEILEDTNVKYLFFKDGEEIIDYLGRLDSRGIDKIGLIITDLEMPQKDGYEVIKYVKESKELNHIPVVVNSSMSDKSVVVKTQNLGSIGFIGKTDPEHFLSAIKDHML